MAWNGSQKEKLEMNTRQNTTLTAHVMMRRRPWTTHTYGILFTVRFSAGDSEELLSSPYSLIGCQDPNKELCRRNWRSKPRISKVNEDADLRITCAGGRSQVESLLQEPRQAKDSRLNQSGSSQKVVLWLTGWENDHSRWHTNPKTWSRGRMTLGGKKGRNSTTRPQTTNKAQADSSRATAGSTFQIGHTKSSTWTVEKYKEETERQTSSSWS